MALKIGLEEQLEALNELSNERHADTTRALDQIHTIVDSFAAKIDLREIPVTAPVHAVRGAVQIATLAAATILAIFVPDQLVGCVLSLSALAFGFFVTRLTKI